MRKENMVFNYEGKIENDELFEMSEYLLGITRKHWICGTDYNPNIQLIAVFEIIDRDEYGLMDDKDNPDYPIIVESSVVAHPKFFSKSFVNDFAENDVIEEHGGKYPIHWALLDAYMYMGGIHVNSETVESAHKCNIETELVKTGQGKFRHFKTYEDAEKYIKDVYVPNMDAIMMMIGFYLDRTWNMIGTTGWDSIYAMTEGKDLFAPAFERMKDELKGNNEETDEELVKIYLPKHEKECDE